MSFVYVKSNSTSVQQSLSDLLLPLSLIVERQSHDVLCFHMETEAYIQAQILIPTLQEDLGESFIALGGFNASQLMRTALDVAEDYAQNQLMDISDLLIVSVMQQDLRLLVSLDDYLKKLPHTLIETAKMMVLCSGHSQRAASLLYLHRNTFLYRLNQFKDQAGIDLREASNLTLFKVYLLLSERLIN